MKLCSIDGCTKEHHAKGLCNTHRMAERRKKFAKPFIAKICLIEGCCGKHKAKGLCAKHYSVTQREKRNLVTARWRAANPDKVKAQAKSLYAQTADKRKAYSRSYYASHGDNQKRWRGDNLDRARAIERAWRGRNIGYVRAKTSARYARKLGAMPAWANKFLIEEFYDLARRRTTIMGFAWHVDHIVPLQSKFVCGLHCEANLQVITGVENQKKQNFRWPDMP